jgi:hypothetical protein
MPQFYQFDEEDIFEMYETIDKQPHVDEKINTTVEISGGMDVPPLKVGLKNSTSHERKVNPPTKTDKFIICLIYFINEKKIISDLEHLVLEDNKLDRFEEFIEQAKKYEFKLQTDRIEEKRQELRNSIVKEIIDEKNKDADTPCILQNCEFKILKNGDHFDLRSIHPISEYLETGKEILISVIPISKTITAIGKDFFERNIGKSVRFTVFGKMKRVYDEEKGTLEIQITPYSIT